MNLWNGIPKKIFIHTVNSSIYIEIGEFLEILRRF